MVAKRDEGGLNKEIAGFRKEKSKENRKTGNTGALAAVSFANKSREREREREREIEREREKRKTQSNLSRFLPQSGSNPVPLSLTRVFSL